jgi:hypothetical protein
LYYITGIHQEWENSNRFIYLTDFTAFHALSIIFAFLKKVHSLKNLVLNVSNEKRMFQPYFSDKSISSLFKGRKMNSLAEKLPIFQTNYHLHNGLKTGWISAILLLLCFFTLQAQVIVYSEGFENNNGSYNHSGTADSWQWGTPSASFTQGPSVANSGLKCWGTNLTGDVPKNHNAYLVSPVITLPSVTGNQVMRVRFFGWIAVDYMYDRGEFQISRDNSTWSTLANLFCTMQGGWNEYYFDITSYAGSQIWLRFRCYTDNSDAFSPPLVPQNNAGFYIDDIAITLTNSPSERTILTFEGNEDPSSSASCPYIFPWNGNSYVKDNDIYSTARGLDREYTDYYLLQQQLVSSGNSYKLQIAEVDEEESYTDLAQLVVVDHDPDVKIANNENGDIFSYGNPIRPFAAADKNGNDVSEKIMFEDSDGYPAHDNEYIVLDFDIPDNLNTATFVLRAKGFVIDSTGEGSSTSSPPRILIQTQQTNGDWVTRNVFLPRVESAVCAYDLNGFFVFSKRVRLLARSCHTGKYQFIDYAGLDTARQNPLTITRLSPSVAVNSIGENFLTRISTADGAYAHMSTGEHITLEFDNPALSTVKSRDFIFISKGYYIPNGTFFFYTWDGTRWVQRDGWSIPVSGDQTRQFDLSLWLPDPAGEYKVRIWQDYIYHPAGIDFVGLTRGTVTGTMSSATDLHNSNNILSSVNSSNDVKLAFPQYTDGRLRDRWVEIRWTGFSTNIPPTTNPVTVTNQSSPAPQINWTYLDAESNPQQQYEVEVWTSPNGTGANVWDPAVGTGTNVSSTYAGSPLTSGQTYYARVKAFDGTSWGGWSEASWTFGTSNLPPVANAGPDQNVPAGASCNASVTLNGTGSNDPDGGAIVTYTWSGPGGPWTGATPVVTLPVGASRIILTVVDNEGSSATDTVMITVIDNLAPVPTVTTLPVLRSSCSITVSPPPTAVDNCTGTVNGLTSDSLIFTTQGTRTIRWTYTDTYGNTSTQTQTVIVKDTIPPVPKVTSLPVIRGECSVAVATRPEALDNCATTVTVSTADPLTYSVQGTYEINWIYNDGNGNTATQKQTVIVDDTTMPVAETPSLPVLRGACSVELTRPYANDICAGRIPGSTSGPLTINQQGTFTIAWSYDDGNGQILTQNQIVIIKDSIAPVLIRRGSDTVLTIKEQMHITNVSITPAVFTDNCTQALISASRSDGLTLDSLFSEGITEITWAACDNYGNCASVVQKVTVNRNRAPVLTIPGDTSMLEGQIITLNIEASDPDGTVPDIFIENSPVPHVFTDNKNGTATVEFRPGCNDHGVYTIRISATDKIDTVQKVFTLKIDDVNFDPVFNNEDYYVAHEAQPFNITLRANDCDGTVPVIRIINNPPGANFTDNHNGTATLAWTPGADDNGYFMIIFEAISDNTTVRDTIIVEVKDVNVWPPVLTVTTTDTTCPLNHSLIINAIARDQDNTPPVVKAAGIPSGASFTADNQGNGIFSWTPRSTGVFTFTVTARDLVDSASFVSAMITIRVTDENVSGPVFSPHPDVIIDQNQRMELNVVAIDPDGTIPVLSSVSKPQRAAFTDNRNGSGTIIWEPQCDDTGTFPITAIATDGRFSDSITIHVRVRDINCAPVLFRIPDINAQYGESVRFEVKAYDPDNDNAALLITVSCNLSGFTFDTDQNGSGIFGWQANSGTGTYPVKFYISDGLLTDSMEMHINIGKTGSAKLSGVPSGVKISSMPSGSYSGEYLGKDSVVFCALPGTYSFQMQSKGYRPERFVCTIKADTTINVSCILKPVIPLMFAPAETLVTQSGGLTVDGSFSLADINGDGISDISCWTHKNLNVHLGMDTGSLIFRPDHITLIDSVRNISPFYHLFVDWDNDRRYDCLYSDNSGSICVINQKKQSIDTILKTGGTRVYPSVYDVDNDLKKDLVILSEGNGVFVYLNSGTDSLPVFQIAAECTDSSGGSLVSMQGPFALVDIDGDGTEDFIVRENGSLRIFKINGNLNKLIFSEDLNCAGKRFTADSSGMFISGTSRGMPVMIVRQGPRLLCFSTRVRGDINGDKKVDIIDIAKISKNWQLIDSDVNWNPLCNLKLSTEGSEVIDIKDISRASKCWELQE